MQFKQAQAGSSLSGLCSHCSIVITRHDVDQHGKHDVNHLNTFQFTNNIDNYSLEHWM